MSLEESNRTPSEDESKSLTEESYDEDIEFVNREISDVDKLYSDSMEYLKRVQAISSRGSLSFTHLQTGNLISLKNTKLALLKQRANLKEKRFTQSLKIKALTGGLGDSSMNVSKILEVLTINGLSYSKLQEIDNSQGTQAEEVSFEEAVANELKDDTKLVSTAPEDHTQLEPPQYIHPTEAANSFEPEDTVTDAFVSKTDQYEVVCDLKGQVYVIDLAKSSEVGIVLANPADFGLGYITDSKVEFSKLPESGLPVAKLCGVEIEIIELE